MANAHEALLQECRDLFREELIGAVEQTFDGMDESFTALAQKATDPAVAKRYLEALAIAREHRGLVADQFSRRLEAEFQERVDRLRKVQSLQAFQLDDLSIVGDDEMNETLSFNGMASRMRWLCEDEMGALDQRAAVLLGLEKVAADDNPFGARVVTDAFKQACQQLDCPLDIRLVFLKAFETLAMDGIRQSCHQVNDVLVSNAILPKIRYGVQKTAEGKTPPPAMARAPEGLPAKPQAAEAPAPASPKDVFSKFAQMLGAPAGFANAAFANAGGSGMAAAEAGDMGAALAGFLSAGSNGSGKGVGGAPLVEGAQLMGSLSSLQRGDLSALGAAAAELGPILAEAGNLKNVLREIKGTSVGASMGQVDAMTLEIVSMLFDALFDDAKIPLALKGLIGRLQLPMLKVAIADKELFSSKSHPARQLLDTLGQLGMRLPADFGAAHPHFAHIEGHVQSLVDGYQDRIEIFSEVRAQLAALVDEADARAAAAMAESEKQLEQTESLAVSKNEVQTAIRSRLKASRSTPRFVAEFLVQQWVKYLVTVHARDGQGSDGWRAACDATSQLIWSVQPKQSAEDRKALMGTIPALLKGLKTGMTVGGIEEPAGNAFMGELMGRHRELMRAPAPTTPLQAVQIAAAETAAAAANDDLDFTAPVVMNNPFGGGSVEVNDDDLDFTVPAPALEPAPAVAPPAPGKPAPVPARPVRQAQKVRLPSKLIVGAWVSVAGDEGEHAAKLHYVSPLKSHYLFVDRQGRKVFECSRTMLARRLKLGEVKLLAGEPDASLFDRIMDKLFGKMGAAPLAQAA